MKVMLNFHPLGSRWFYLMEKRFLLFSFMAKVMKGILSFQGKFTPK